MVGSSQLLLGSDYLESRKNSQDWETLNLVHNVIRILLPEGIWVLVISREQTRSIPMLIKSSIILLLFPTSPSI